MSDLFISAQNQTSGRFVILADEGPAIWMYLTISNGQSIVSDCWIQNLVPTPDDLSAYREERNAPPATKAFAHADSHQPSPNPNTVRFEWAPDGDSVALFIDDILSGFMTSSSKLGFSRNLTTIGPFGSPIDQDQFNSLFNRPSVDA